MDEKELLKERFKSAVSSAVKVISENFDLEIKFSNNVNSKKNFNIKFFWIANHHGGSSINNIPENYSSRV